MLEEEWVWPSLVPAVLECRPSVLVISGLFCSLDLRVGGLGAGRLGTGEGAGGGRRLVTCFTSAFPLVRAGEILEDDFVELTKVEFCPDSFNELLLLYPRPLFEYPRLLFEVVVLVIVLLILLVEKGLE